MTNYIIGLIDDDPINLMDIKRIFIRYAKFNNCHFDFESFYSDDYGASFDDVLNKITTSIFEQQIDCLLVDYKLVFTQETNKGAEIINWVRKTVPEFPCVILTGRADECLKEAQVDPDKIYIKSEFLKIGTSISEQLLKKILINIERVKTATKNLENTIQVLKTKLLESQEEDDSEIISQIIENEAELNKYCILEQSELDKVYDTSYLENIVQLIEKTKTMI